MRGNAAVAPNRTLSDGKLSFKCPPFLLAQIIFQILTNFSTQLYVVSVLLADNGMVAWRSGGIYALPFKSALPAAVAPNRAL
jgi:hypothetical protein